MLEMLMSVCLFPTVIPSMCILLKSVVVLEDNNLDFLNNMMLSVLFDYHMHTPRETDLSSIALRRNPGSAGI